MTAEGFLSDFMALLRVGLNVDEPEGRPVPGRELLPMELDDDMVIPPRKFVGRHRRHESMVAEDVAHIDEKDRSSLPVYPSWLPGGER